MNTFFTSDMHLGHANICCYCKRPFLRPWSLLEEYTTGKPKWRSNSEALSVAERMNNRLIHEWNMRVKPCDIVYHLGDFCTKGMVYGTPAVGTRASGYEEKLNGKIIHIRGNHDKNNGVKGQCIDTAIMSLSHFTVMLVHIPPQHPGEIPDFVDFVLCGHVHGLWGHKMLGDVPMINVGVDVRNFRPMSHREVLREYSRIVKHK